MTKINETPFDPYLPVGDVVAAVQEILSTAEEMQGFGIARIADDYKGYATGMNWVTITEAGGTSRYPMTDSVRIDLDVFSATRSIASQIINTAIAVLQREQSNFVGHGVRLVGVRVETSAFAASRRSEDDHRFIASLRLVVRPA